MEPVILNPKLLKDKKIYSKLKKSVLVVDEIREQIKELELIKNPKLLLSPEKIDLNKKYKTLWIYYPWRNTLVHCLEEKDFKNLRVSRNQNLITKDEQKKFEKFRVGVAGLNVGNPGAVCLALEGDIEMKLADNDGLSVSNLNRFRAGLPDLGLNKATLTARQIYEINPFAQLTIFPNGITEENISGFLLKPRLNVLVEEMDNLPLKIKIRELTRAYKIPTIMVTGNGEDVIIDIERYDLKPNLPLLNGFLKERVVNGIMAGPKSFKEKIILARDFMDKKYLCKRLAASFDRVGKDLAGIPQIAESSFLRGAAICYFVRRIAQGKNIKSGRYYLKLSDVHGYKQN